MRLLVVHHPNAARRAWILGMTTAGLLTFLNVWPEAVAWGVIQGFPFIYRCIDWSKHTPRNQGDFYWWHLLMDLAIIVLAAIAPRLLVLAQSTILQPRPLSRN